MSTRFPCGYCCATPSRLFSRLGDLLPPYPARIQPELTALNARELGDPVTGPGSISAARAVTTIPPARVHNRPSDPRAYTGPAAGIFHRRPGPVQAVLRRGSGSMEGSLVHTGEIELGAGASLRWWASGFERPLLLIHPSGTDHSLWDPVLPWLTDQRDVIRYDLRGHGDSPPGRGSYRHADDLLRLLDGLRLDRVDVVGASYGGQVAIEAAAVAPERIRALAVLGSSMPGHRWSPEVVAAAQAQAAALAVGDIDEAVRWWMDTWVRGPRRSWEDLNPAMWDLFVPPLRRSFAWEDGGAVDLEPGSAWAAQLATTPRAALVAVGDLDLDDCLAIAAKLGDLLSVPPVRVAGVGHLLGAEDPVATGTLLREFLANLD